MTTEISQPTLPFLHGGGEMGEMIRQYNWAQTPLGNPEQWPQSLKTTLSIIINSKFPMFLFWGPEMICFYNDAFRPSLGVGGKHPWALGSKGEQVWEEIWPTIKPWLDQVIIKGEAVWMEDQLVPFYRNGQIEDIYWTFSYSPVCDESGVPAGVFVACTETTEKIEHIKSLKAANNQFQEMVLQAPVAIAVFRGKQFLAEVANNAYLDIVGRTKEEFLGKPMFESIPEVKEQLEPIANELMRTGKAFEAREFSANIYRNGKKQLCYFNFVWEPLKNEHGETDGFVVVAHEITDHVSSRKKAEESEYKIRSFVESAPFPIGVYEGREMRIQFANQSIIDVFAKGNDVIGKLYSEILPELKNQQIFEQLDQVFTTGKPFHAKHQQILINVNGELQTFYFNYSFTPLYNIEGKIYGVMNTAADVTDLNIAKKHLEESEARFRLLADSMPQFVWTGNKKGEIEYFNQAVFNYTNVPVDELIERGWMEIIHPDDKEENIKAWVKSIVAGNDYVFNHRIKNKEGSYRWHLSRAVPLKDENGEIILWVGTSTDIHDHKLFEDELNRQVELRTSELEEIKNQLQKGNLYLQHIINKFESAIVSLVPIFKDGKIVDFYFKMTNDAYSKYSQIAPADIQGKIVSDIFPAYYQTDAFVKYVETYETGATNDWELHYNVDGLDVYMHVVATRMNDEVVVHFIDYTNLKNLELDLLRKIEELERSNKNLEEFAYAASHDLKEPIRKIHFFADRLKGELKESLNPANEQLFSRLEVATDRMRALVDDLLSYSQVSVKPREFKAVDLNILLKNVMSDLELEIEEKQAVIKHDTLPVIRGHMRQLQQLFQNLLSNAIKYRKPDAAPVIDITVKKISGFESDLPMSSEQKKKEYHLIEVADNGIGFDMQHAEKIFQVFQRLHGNTEYKGTGVGLSIARKVAENHYGFLAAKSELDKGAKFTLLLPVDDGNEIWI